MTSDRPLTLNESADLTARQQHDVARAVHVDERPLYLAWGLAWLLGSGLHALTDGADPLWDAPGWIAGAVLAVLASAAAAITVTTIRRAGAGLSGPSARAGSLYGWAWPLSFVGLACLAIGNDRLGASDEAVSVLWVAGAAFVVGLLYLAGGALWGSPVQYALGAWLVVTAAVGSLLGLTGLYAVMALAGGGGFLVAAALAGRARPC